MIRPLAVWVSTAFSDFTARERALLGWAGLRGAVPIVLGTFVLSSEHVGHGETIFNAVFFVVVVSALVQGTTLEWVAARLGLVDPPAAGRRERRSRSTQLGSLELDRVRRRAATTRSPARPSASSACRAARSSRSSPAASETIPPRGSTVIEPGDRLFVLVPRGTRGAIEDVFSPLAPARLASA